MIALGVGVELASWPFADLEDPLSLASTPTRAFAKPVLKTTSGSPAKNGKKNNHTKEEHETKACLYAFTGHHIKALYHGILAKLKS